jgi:Protein of unknown function (DUF4238)
MIRGLYSYSIDVAESRRNIIEQKLMSRIDNDGARVLQKLYKPNGLATISEDDRISFAVFINSLRLRTPETFAYNAIEAEAVLRRKLAANDPRLEKVAAKIALDGLSFTEWVEKNHPIVLKNFGHELLAKFIVEPKFVNRVLQMRWAILDRKSSDTYFVTSDRPLIVFGGTKTHDLVIALAISKNQVFFAMQDPSSVRHLLNMPTNRFIHQVNTSTIQQAKSKAFAKDKSHSFSFFQNQLGVHHNILPWTEYLITE